MILIQTPVLFYFTDAPSIALFEVSDVTYSSHFISPHSSRRGVRNLSALLVICPPMQKTDGANSLTNGSVAFFSRSPNTA